ncbi:MAG: DNA methyltransferase [Kiritimatiellae bacterium]|nr:DNA methyltransferase [Kiritimatiellia bacterium]
MEMVLYPRVSIGEDVVMSAVSDLIEQVENPELRERLRREVDKLNKQKKFGLVFEEHLPEATPLHDIPVKKGSLVALKDGDLNRLFRVEEIDGATATCLNPETKQTEVRAIDSLVSVARFGDPIYPCLKPMDSVCNAPESDVWHALIEADNYHALQLLEYLHAGKVDCIYIDPPYNTGARDWKYNNDYVDGNDAYRHSKWLSMMQKRLRIAKRILNPKNSVLIVTIDEKEYLHLGCLLEEMFPDARLSMISSVINPAGAGRQDTFSRTDEYIFFVQIGISKVLPESRSLENVPIVWDSLRRSSLANARGKHGKGACGPNQFYPIYVENTTGRIKKIGVPIMEGVDRNSAEQIPGCTAVFPVRPDGTEMNWGIKPEEAESRLKKGYLRAGKFKQNEPQKYVISYVTGGNINDIENGIAIVSGYGDDGGVIAHYPSGRDKLPTTNWNRPLHDAQRFGTNVLREIIGARFQYPKSLYAVMDSLRLCCADKPDALIVDFFAGSGTTLHAVNLLNAVDGGRRRCILVTNNEVSEAEAKTLSAQGHSPGDVEWEKLGIARYVTWPRTVCSIEGRDVNGNPLKGKYVVGDRPMADGFKANAGFFKLSFQDKDAVALGRQFKEMLPMLWMKAGARGVCPTLTGAIPKVLILPENRFAVLLSDNAFPELEDALDEHPGIETVYIVTDYEPGYRAMAKNLKVKSTYQLYRDYLDNFRINMERNRQ